MKILREIRTHALQAQAYSRMHTKAFFNDGLEVGELGAIVCLIVARRER
jgi:hypothetical protein